MATGGSISPKWTPLHLAAMSGDLSEIRKLIRSGADLGARDHDGLTPLMLAVEEGQEDSAVILVKAMTDSELSVVDSINGSTVLHLMAWYDRIWSQVIDDIVNTCPTVLLQRDKDGDRPLDIARDYLPRTQVLYDIIEPMTKRQQQQQQQQQQFAEGIAGNEEHPCNITITVVGHHGVGKSCFVRQLKQESIPEGGPGSTDTADFYVNFLGYNPDTGYRETMDEGGEIETGRQRLKRIIDRYRKDANTAVQPPEDKPAPHHDREEDGSTSTPDLPTASTNAATVEAQVSSARKRTGTKQKLKKFFSKLPFRRKVKEIPQPQPQQPQPQPQQITEEQRHVIEQVMVSEKEDKPDEEVKGYVTIYDFGGEKVFYNSHHCFMSSNMVFVLVFDVAMCLDPSRAKDGYERIEFWLRNIATYAIDRTAHGKGTPPIILVGSHLDLVSNNKNQQRSLFASVLEQLCKKPELRKIMETHVQEMYPMADLNNSSINKDIYERVWEKIISIAHLQSQWMKPVPARWVALEYELVRLKNEGRIILTYADLLELNSKSTVPLAKDDVMEFIMKLRFSGSFLCFDIYSKSPFIVLQPQWIIHAFKAIITAPKFTSYLSTKQEVLWADYEKSGVLSLDFIRQLWNRPLEGYRLLEEEERLFIIMETLGLLAKPVSVDAEVDYFIVPSILQPADPEIISKVLADPDTVTTVTLCVAFDNPFIPQAVWDKMIASCIHRFQRLTELGYDGLTFIRRGFACLSVDCLWNMIINCNDNAMKVTMFKKDTVDHIPTGTGINLLKILEFLLRRILQLNHQSHLGYQFYLHNDYRFAAEEKMVKVDDLRQTPRLQCFGSNGTRWIDRDDLSIWFGDPDQKKKGVLGVLQKKRVRGHRRVGKIKGLPDRKLSIKEIGRVSRYIGGTYQTFFVEFGCPIHIVEQEMEEHRHLTFRSRMAKILLHWRNTKADITFSTLSDAMSRHGMDYSKLIEILDSNRDTVFRDETLTERWLQTKLSVSDVPVIAARVNVKSYFNLFLELGLPPETVDEFDDHYRNKKTREKITALMKACIEEAKPSPTVNSLLLAMQECDMDTESVIQALRPS